jgi:hypothetical protein
MRCLSKVSRHPDRHDAHHHSQRSGVHAVGLLQALALNLLHCDGLRSIRTGPITKAHGIQRMRRWMPSAQW